MVKMIILTRSEAASAGLKTYVNGKDCKNGHVSPARRTANASCVECQKSDNTGAKLRQEKFKQKNHERLKEIKRESMRRSRDVNKEKHLQYARERMRALNKTESGKLRQFLKGSLRRCLQHKNGVKSYDIVGYGFEDIKKHITSMFTDGMSWDNYGKWHIDHIKPIKAFLDEGVTDPKIINSLENLQPLWAFDNISKGCKLNG